jgi:hypothetical protein
MLHENTEHPPGLERLSHADQTRGVTSAHGFAGYNAALLGRADETLGAIEHAMRLDQTDRKQGIFFFGGFAELRQSSRRYLPLDGRRPSS